MGRLFPCQLITSVRELIMSTQMSLAQSLQPMETRHMLPASISFRRSKIDPANFSELNFESFKVIGFLGSGMFHSHRLIRPGAPREEEGHP